MPDVLTLTLNPSVDASTSVPQVIADRKLRCTAARYDPGGGGINVARVVHRLGGAASALYLAGGPTGDLLDRLLDAEGIDRRRVPTHGWTRENVVVDETNSNRQFRFGMPGPTVLRAEWEAVLAELPSVGPAPFLVASGSVPPGVPADVYARIAREAARSGFRLVLDTSGEPLRLALDAGVHLVKPNVRELVEFVGRPIEGEAAVEAAVRAVVASGGSEVVVVSLGAAGAVMGDAAGVHWLRAPTVPIRSRVGAGDSMLAGIVLGLARGLTRRDAVRFGVAAGSAAVMTPGTELCRREDVEHLFAQAS